MPEDKKTVDTMVSELVAAIVAGIAATTKAAAAGAKDGMTAPPGAIIQGEPAPIVHTQPVHRNARDLKQVTDIVELNHWFSEFGEQATPKRIGEIYAFERDQNIPEDQQTKFYRR